MGRALRDEVMAPATEEFVFRACLVRLWDSAGFAPALIICGCPWCFAFAHAHHFAEHVRQREDKRVALVQVAIQVAYTSVFGAYVTFLLLRTGSTVAVVLVHSFCNRQGFPDLGFLGDERHPLRSYSWFVLALYLLGIAAFAFLLDPLTAGF